MQVFNCKKLHWEQCKYLTVESCTENSASIQLKKVALKERKYLTVKSCTENNASI